jgi:hypothetical protein
MKMEKFELIVTRTTEKGNVFELIKTSSMMCCCGRPGDKQQRLFRMVAVKEMLDRVSQELDKAIKPLMEEIEREQNANV